MRPLSKQIVFLTMLAVGVVCGKSLLSFGGNGNVGSAILRNLIDQRIFDTIFLVSRGKWHFDSAQRIGPHVTNLICDRAAEPDCLELNVTDCDPNALRASCPDLMTIVNNTETFDLVLDFSAYEIKWVHDAAEVLEGKVGLYIYFSSDAVYEVSVAKTSNRPSVESDAVRPKDPTVRQNLIEADRYGDAKLGGEEVLRHRQQFQNGFPWVAFRMADVFGPRDTSYRWQLYQFWIMFHSAIGSAPPVPEIVEHTVESFTFVDDVVQAVNLVLKKGQPVWNEAYNIALNDQVTLRTILSKMSQAVNDSLTESDFESGSDFYLYPTVFSGPMNISKAKDRLGFVPSDMTFAFRSTVDWYIERFLTNSTEREDILSRLLQDAVPARRKNHLYLAVDALLFTRGVEVQAYRAKRKGDPDDLEPEAHELPHPEL